jgi:DNA end-binding protein Ku
MRSIWKGAISFGLVTIPVKLYSATEERDVSFHQVHRSDGGRIRYKRVCTVDGEEVAYADIAKGYELSTGEVVVLDDDDFADLPLRTSRSIEVLTFVPLEEVDPIYFARSYYLEPESSGAKPYVLLREALEKSGRVAIVKVALRQRESLATLRIHDGVFVLETMLWPDEIRRPDFKFLDEEVDVRPQELAMAASLIETMTGDFEPEQYTDEYREALQRLIEAKIEGREVVSPPETESGTGTVVDLMSALRASVEAAKRGRGEPAEAAAVAGGGGGAARARQAAAPATKSAKAKPAPKSAGSGRAAKSTGSGRAAKSTHSGPAAKSTKSAASKTAKRASTRKTA